MSSFPPQGKFLVLQKLLLQLTEAHTPLKPLQAITDMAVCWEAHIFYLFGWCCDIDINRSVQRLGTCCCAVSTLNSLSMGDKALLISHQSSDEFFIIKSLCYFVTQMLYNEATATVGFSPTEPGNALSLLTEGSAERTWWQKHFSLVSCV